MLILGASGGCGKHLVNLAVDRGHEVTAVIRPGSEAPQGASLEVGEVTDPAFLAPIVADHRVILSCLGLRRASFLPWSKLLSPPNLVETVTRTLIESAHPEARIIWISAGGVADSRDQCSLAVRRLIGTANVGVAYTDLEAAEALTAGDDRWLAVRPVTLLNGAPTGRAGKVPRYGLLSTIRRGDVAQWMLDVADGTREFEGSAVLLGSDRTRARSSAG